MRRWTDGTNRIVGRCASADGADACPHADASTDADPTPSPSPTPPGTNARVSRGFVARPGDHPAARSGTTGSRFVPETFTVKFDRTTITFGDLSAPVLLWQTTDGSGLIGVFARPNGLNLQIVFDPADGKGMWTLSGIPGQASGTLTVVR